MGGSASITIIMGLVKNKFAALLIGTVGVGLQASFMAIQSLMVVIAGLGISSSAVRDVAQAVASDNPDSIGRVAMSLQRVSWLAGLLGMATMALLSPRLSLWTFGNEKYKWDIASLGLIILFSNITNGKLALIQGMRRIGDFAMLQMIGAFVTTTLTVGFYTWLDIRGIVPALVFSAAIQLVVTWHYSKRVPVPQVDMSWSDSFKSAGVMIRLGISMMWTGLLANVVIYATVAMITNRFDLRAVGIYSAAFALSGAFVNFVLHAMGADYYPRLASLADNKAGMNRLVNEQTEIGLLIAMPGIIAMLALAPWIIKLFYSKEFLPAIGLLQWFILGCYIRIIQWPMGFLQLALGKSIVWFSTQTAFSIVSLALIYIGLKLFGLQGVSIAFFLHYGFSLLVISGVAKYLTQFSWSKETRLLIFRSVCLVAIAFLCVKALSPFASLLVCMGIEIVLFVVSIKELANRVGPEHKLVKKLLQIPGLRNLIA